MNEQNKFQLVPNPASGHFYIEGFHSGTIEILDVAGRKIHSENILNRNQYIRTSDFIPSIYIVHISDKNADVFLKLVVNR